MDNDLVKRLRNATSYDPRIVVEDCKEAADAIEELQAVVDGLTAQTNMVFEETKGRTVIKFEPKWIPATDKEHIPNTDHGIVGYFGGGAFNQLRWYDFITTLSDGTIVGESTERDVINEHCIAVYKLPEPPKEETE